MTGRVEILHYEDGAPLRCENCRAMFACQPATQPGERGYVCRRCQRIQDSLNGVPTPNVTFMKDRETFGDCQLAVILEDV